MANENHTVDVVKPKSNRKYSKRLMLTIGVVSLFALILIMNSVYSGGQSGKRKDVAPEALMPAIVPHDVYKVEQAPKPEIITSKPLDLPMMIEDTRPEPTREVIYQQSPQPVQQQTDPNRQRWLEMQRSAFVSKPNVDGQWVNQTAEKTDTSSSKKRDSLSDYEEMLRREEVAARQLDSLPTLSEKEKFFNASRSGKGYLTNTRTAPISPYVLPSGTMIPCSLISGVNSDLPGHITAQVTENVYDWVKPHVVLIPQGTRVFGVYDSNIAFAQKRIQVSWTRLIFPDGSTLDLEGMPGADKQGYSGLRDKHYAHYGRMLTAALATAAFGSVGLLFDSGTDTVASSTGTVVVQNDNNAQAEFARAIAENLGQMGQSFFNKTLNVQPTILIRPGTRFNILCNADVPFYERWR